MARSSKLRYNVHQSDKHEFIITSVSTAYMMYMSKIAAHTYNIVIAVIDEERDDSPGASSSFLTFLRETYNTVIYTKLIKELREELDDMAKAITTGAIDLDDPVDFALCLGGMVANRNIAATSQIHASRLH